MIAVTGAAGNVGGKVAHLLLEAGEEIRALEHNRDLSGLRKRGAEVVSGDVSSVDEFTDFLDGARAALVLLPENMADPDFVENRAAMARAMCDAIRKSGVRHVVALSAAGAARADAPGPPAGLHGFEQDLRTLDNTNVLVLRSAAYMDYLLAALPMIQAQKVNGSAVDPNVRVPMIATRDVAREAAQRLRLQDFTGHEIKLLLGPEDVTMSEATRAIGERIGIPDLPYVQFPPDAVKGALLGAGMSEQAAGLVVDVQLAWNERIYFEGIERTPDSVTPTRFGDFLRQALPEGAETDEEEAHL
jgi:uncharacterized protein YbjT (DUF2867 family)